MPRAARAPEHDPSRDLRRDPPRSRHPRSAAQVPRPGRCVAGTRGARCGDRCGPPEALVCYDDQLALGLMDALRGLGVRIPDDMGIVGFDGIPFAAISNPRLTTVVVPSAEMGRAAASSAIQAVHDGRLPDGVLSAGRDGRPREHPGRSVSRP